MFFNSSRCAAVIDPDFGADEPRYSRRGVMADLLFQTIDLSVHSALCVKFRLDSYLCSFADGQEQFEADSGKDGKDYIEWLQQRIIELPLGCVHVWEGTEVIGQIESRLRDDGSGYVNLFYLTPEHRGSGKGRQLHDYAMSVFAARGVRIIQLTVSVQNSRALGFYQKLGWKNIGLRPGREDSLLFEYVISGTES